MSLTPRNLIILVVVVLLLFIVAVAVSTHPILLSTTKTLTPLITAVPT
jgi:hypothetical protein